MRDHHQFATNGATAGFKRNVLSIALAAGIALAVGAVWLALATTAKAAPRPLGAAPLQSNLIQIRDGCGRGMRFSHSRDRCVEDFQRPDDFRDERRRDGRRSHHDDDDGAAAAAVGLGVLGAIIGSGNNNDRHRATGHDNRGRGVNPGRPAHQKRDFGGDGQDD
ncbi:hypothetical protein OO17_12400 [Rhodopseudomonas palustris]|uniref:Uncharacterized protein n=2 Tax=Nitrobacteraceae TaxID=41294 RepID=A0A0D7ETL3_RHOPL|nr:hypothetical protein [Rhodopseudomonas sp. BAL398]KIZ42752.1 hypothetical protein OO17_12400 [Rhodopseudomonas palustris]WOK19263.1 hypothetical protein RBJ75_07030 [Rhodopseudomonas sp. BAL398]